MNAYPLKFAPQERRTLWGRELWLASAHPSQPSVVVNGPYAGRTLPDLFAEFGGGLAGGRSGSGFPLLVKIVDARERLSLQVHPNESAAKRCGGEPKTEMWYVLDGAPGASVCVGFRPGIDRESFVRMLHGGRADETVARFGVGRGDVFFIPGGLVHSVGGGCRLFEVQQTSDTTWRLHDWGRVDPATGKPRTVNEREALESIDWSLPPPEVVRSGAGSMDPLVDCRYFRFSAMDLAGTVQMPALPDGMRVLFASEGACEVLAEGCEAVSLAGDECVLIPPGLAFSARPGASCRLLVAES